MIAEDRKLFAVVLCVAMVCASAIICALILREPQPRYRYEKVSSYTGTQQVFRIDIQTGEATLVARPLRMSEIELEEAEQAADAAVGNDPIVEPPTGLREVTIDEILGKHGGSTSQLEPSVAVPQQAN